MIAAVDIGALADVVWVSFVAGTAITLVFSLVVLSGARSAAARREGRGEASAVYGAAAAIAFAVFLAIVVYGVHIMLSKD